MQQSNQIRKEVKSHREEKLIENIHLNQCVAVPLYRKGSEAYDLYLLLYSISAVQA